MSSSVRPKKVRKRPFANTSRSSGSIMDSSTGASSVSVRSLASAPLHVRDVAHGADHPRRPSAVIDDHAAGHEPARVVARLAQAAPRSGACAFAAGEARVEVMVRSGLRILGVEAAEKCGHAVAERAVFKTEELVQPRREIGAVGNHVPVPQPVAGAARRKRIALLRKPQPLVGLRPLHGAGDQRLPPSSARRSPAPSRRARYGSRRRPGSPSSRCAA